MNEPYPYAPPADSFKLPIQVTKMTYDTYPNAVIKSVPAPLLNPADALITNTYDASPPPIPQPDALDDRPGF